jgi:hypothetical protein
MYKENNGIIRGFSVMGMAIGMVLYHYILSELLVNAITKLIRTLFRPFGIAFGWVKRFVLYLRSIGKKIMNFLIRRLKKTSKSVKITLDTRKKAASIKRNKRLEKKAAEKKEAEKKAAEKRIAEKKAVGDKEKNKNEAKNKRLEKKTTNNKVEKNKENEKKTTGNQVVKNKREKD